MKNILCKIDEVVNAHADKLTRDELYTLMRMNFYALNFVPYTLILLKTLRKKGLSVPIFTYDSLILEILRTDDVELFKYVEGRVVNILYAFSLDAVENPRIFEYLRPRLRLFLRAETCRNSCTIYRAMRYMPEIALEVPDAHPHLARLFMQSGNFSVAEALVQKFNLRYADVVRCTWCRCCSVISVEVLDWLYDRARELFDGEDDVVFDNIIRAVNELPTLKWYTSRFGVENFASPDVFYEIPFKNIESIAHLNECGYRVQLRDVHPNIWAEYAAYFNIRLTIDDVREVFSKRVFNQIISKEAFMFLKDECGITIEDLLGINLTTMEDGLILHLEDLVNVIAAYKPASDEYIKKVSISSLMADRKIMVEVCGLYPNMFTDKFTRTHLEEFARIYARVVPEPPLDAQE